MGGKKIKTLPSSKDSPVMEPMQHLLSWPRGPEICLPHPQWRGPCGFRLSQRKRAGRFPPAHARRGKASGSSGEEHGESIPELFSERNAPPSSAGHPLALARAIFGGLIQMLRRHVVYGSRFLKICFRVPLLALFIANLWQ